MRSVTTIIVEPRTLLREGLVSLLRHSGFRVISAVPTLDKVPLAALRHASLLMIGAPSETAEALDYLNGISRRREKSKSSSSQKYPARCRNRIF